MARRSSPSSRDAPSARDGDKKRYGELLAVAERIFYERGYSSASVQDIADELGMLKGSLYYYIESKEDLLFRLLLDSQDHVDAVMQQVAEAADDPVLERIERYLAGVVDYNTANLPRVTIYYHDLERLSDKRRERLLDSRHAHEKFLENLIVEAQDAGLVPSGADARILSLSMFATVIWPYRWFKGREADRKRVIAECTAFAIAGLTGVQPPSSDAEAAHGRRGTAARKPKTRSAS